MASTRVVLRKQSSGSAARRASSAARAGHMLHAGSCDLSTMRTWDRGLTAQAAERAQLAPGACAAGHMPRTAPTRGAAIAHLSGPRWTLHCWRPRPSHCRRHARQPRQHATARSAQSACQLPRLQTKTMPPTVRYRNSMVHTNCAHTRSDCSAGRQQAQPGPAGGLPQPRQPARTPGLSSPARGARAAAHSALVGLGHLEEAAVDGLIWHKACGHADTLSPQDGGSALQSAAAQAASGGLHPAPPPGGDPLPVMYLRSLAALARQRLPPWCSPGVCQAY